MSINIIGGRSAFRQVGILSDQLTVIAYFREDGKIHHKIITHGRLSLFLYKRKWLKCVPLLQLIRMALFLIDTMSKSGRLIVGSVMLGFVLTQIFMGSAFHTPTNPFLMWCVITGMLVVGYYFHFQCIGPWHGAEHMAIAAYRKHRSRDMEVIRQQNRVDDNCGGRLLLPTLVLIAIANIAAYKLGMHQPAIASLAALEFTLWIDGLVSWNRIPLARQASHFLQKRITTRQPGDKELQIAQQALKTLINAHG